MINTADVLVKMICVISRSVTGARQSSCIDARQAIYPFLAETALPSAPTQGRNTKLFFFDWPKGINPKESNYNLSSQGCWPGLKAKMIS
jgi:hypothetical protein